jgi:hypothetical protein
MSGSSPTWAALFGPAATRTDGGSALAAALMGAVLALALTFQAEPSLDAFAATVTALVAFDLFGGLWSNAQGHAWRGVRRSRRGMGLFAALHPHAFVIAWALAEYRMIDAVLLWATATLGVAAVAAVAPGRRSALALTVCGAGVGLLVWINGSPALAWLPAACLLKLVAAYAARPDDPA